MTWTNFPKEAVVSSVELSSIVAIYVQLYAMAPIISIKRSLCAASHVKSVYNVVIYANEHVERIVIRALCRF